MKGASIRAMSNERPASVATVVDAAPADVHPSHDTTGSIRAVPRRSRRQLALASLGALGVVYGDIGTSPLYAIRECLAWKHSPHAVQPTLPNVLGVLSLVFWAL